MATLLLVKVFAPPVVAGELDTLTVPPVKRFNPRSELLMTLSDMSTEPLALMLIPRSLLSMVLKMQTVMVASNLEKQIHANGIRTVTDYAMAYVR